MVGPALDMAYDVAERDYGIRFDTYLKLYPDFCNATFTAGAIADLYYQVRMSFLVVACFNLMNMKDMIMKLSHISL